MTEAQRTDTARRQEERQHSGDASASTSLESDSIDESEPLDTEVVAPETPPTETPERAYSNERETFSAEEELDDMLDEVTSRDPEALASDMARRHSPDPQGDLSPEARRFFDRTTELTADELDTEELDR